MPRLKIKHVHGIRTPRDLAFVLKLGPYADQPYLFAKSPWYFCFHWFFTLRLLKLRTPPIHLPWRCHAGRVTHVIVLNKEIGPLRIG